MFKPLVRMKHWHLFLGILVIPMIVQFVAMGSIFAAVTANEKPEPSMFTPLLIALPIILISSMYFTYGWQWAIISNLREKMPSGIKFPLKRIKFFYLFQVIYMLIFIGGIVSIFAFVLSVPDPEHAFKGGEPPAFIFILPLLLFPLHLFLIFCQFHNFFFTGKIIKAVELQREVKFEDFAAEFFLVWFHIIGVWILQPRINNIVEGTADLGEGSKEVVDDVPMGDDEVI